MPLLALLASLASGAWAAPRSRPDNLRPGSALEGAPLCRDLRPHAGRLKWTFAPSQDNMINCGAGGGESSNYILVEQPSQPYELHVISVDEGSFPVMTGDPSVPDRSVQVVVYKTRKPVVLALAARAPTLWDVTVTPEARVELVIIQGKGKQVLRGVPDEIPVARRSWEQACAYAQAWEPRRNLVGPDLPLLMTSLRCSTGLRESSFQGCAEGAVFEVPHYRQEGAAKEDLKWEPPCPLPVDPDAPLVRRRDPLRREAEVPEEHPARVADPVRAAEPEPEPRPRPAPRGAVRDPFASMGRGGALKPPVGAPPHEEAEPEPIVTQAPAPDRPPAKPALESPPPAAKPEVLPAPESAPARDDIPVRALAILMKGDVTLLTHDAVPDLIIALERGDETLRWRAADALGQLGSAAVSSAPALLKATKSDSWRVRSSAALALGNVGASERKVVKALRRLLKDKHPDTRHSAQTALSRLTPN
ncbi:hypothetical protein EPO15_08180 [bacterium]|nr:MAG: hypothetical protein EPO15_08180 [bacterium]